jgi:hypothetical protein
MKRYTPNSIHSGLLALFIFLPLQLSAGDAMDELNEARLEGQIWMAYALNEHLSVFDLEIDVNRSEATISGQVEDDVQKDLAEQVALDMSGIDSVDNRIEVTDDAIRRSHDDPPERTIRICRGMFVLGPWGQPHARHTAIQGAKWAAQCPVNPAKVSHWLMVSGFFPWPCPWLARRPVCPGNGFSASTGLQHLPPGRHTPRP